MVGIIPVAMRTGMVLKINFANQFVAVGLVQMIVIVETSSLGILHPRVWRPSMVALSPQRPILEAFIARIQEAADGAYRAPRSNSPQMSL